MCRSLTDLPLYSKTSIRLESTLLLLGDFVGVVGGASEGVVIGVVVGC